MIAKADIRRVQEWMGHADIQTTMKYLHYAPRTEDAELVARAFGRESPERHGRPHPASATSWTHGPRDGSHSRGSRAAAESLASPSLPQESSPPQIVRIGQAPVGRTARVALRRAVGTP